MIKTSVDTLITYLKQHQQDDPLLAHIATPIVHLNIEQLSQVVRVNVDSLLSLGAKLHRTARSSTDGQSPGEPRLADSSGILTDTTILSNNHENILQQTRRHERVLENEMTPFRFNHKDFAYLRSKLLQKMMERWERMYQQHERMHASERLFHAKISHNGGYGDNTTLVRTNPI